MRRLLVALLIGGSVLAGTVTPTLADLRTPGGLQSAPVGGLDTANSASSASGSELSGPGDYDVADGGPP